MRWKLLFLNLIRVGSMELLSIAAGLCEVSVGAA